MPLLVGLLARACKILPLIAPAPIARIAMRAFPPVLSRIGLAVAALSIAIATTIGVGVMIESFRVPWLTGWINRLNSDILYQPRAESAAAPMPVYRRAIQTIEQHPESVASVWLNRAARIESQWGPMRLMAVSDNPCQYTRFF